MSRPLWIQKGQRVRNWSGFNTKGEGRQYGPGALFVISGYDVVACSLSMVDQAGNELHGMPWGDVYAAFDMGEAVYSYLGDIKQSGRFVSYDGAGALVLLDGERLPVSRPREMVFTAEPVPLLKSGDAGLLQVDYTLADFEEWDAGELRSDARARLLADVVICGVPCHLEAIQVTTIGGVQVAASKWFQNTLELLEGANGDAPFKTWSAQWPDEAEPRDYVVWACPYSGGIE